VAQESDRERFHATSGQVTGWSCVALAAAVVVLYVLERDRGMPAWVAAAAVCFGAVAWAALLRPAVTRVGATLELRNPFETVTLPLEAVEAVTVRQVLALRAAGRRWTSPAIGRSGRQVRRDERAARRGAAVDGDDESSYAEFVEQRIRQAAEDARRGARLAEGQQSTRAVARRPAWPEIGAIAVSGVATLALALL